MHCPTCTSSHVRMTHPSVPSWWVTYQSATFSCPVSRVMRRRVKLNNGEDSDNRSGNDRDSGNEKRIKKKAEKKRSRPKGFGFGGRNNPFGFGRFGMSFF